MTKYNNETMCPASSTARIKIPSFEYYDLDYFSEDSKTTNNLNSLEIRLEYLLKECAAATSLNFLKQSTGNLPKELIDPTYLKTSDNPPHPVLTSLLETLTAYVDPNFNPLDPYNTKFDAYADIIRPNIETLDLNPHFSECSGKLCESIDNQWICDC